MATKTKHFWIARNKDGGLYLYRTKPKIAQTWNSIKNVWTKRLWFDGEIFAKLKATSFKEITWENSPQKVSVTIAIGGVKKIPNDNSCPVCGSSLDAEQCCP